MQTYPAIVSDLPDSACMGAGTAFGRPRDFLGNQFVYAVLSPRARGLSLGVNMNPDKRCNFDCAYCEVDRSRPGRAELDADAMADELQRTLALVQAGGLRQLPAYAAVPEELLKLHHVALSGDGEPTLCPQFLEVVQAVTHVRARSRPFFKLVLITNASNLGADVVQRGIRLFTLRDEIWAKLEAGTPEYMQRVNAPDVGLEQIMANIQNLARQRPVVIQSLFPLIDGVPPSQMEIEAFAERLRTLKDNEAQISLVQIYSATRPASRPGCSHLPLQMLSRIAQTVRRVSGFHAEVF